MPLVRSVCRLLYDRHAQTFVFNCYKGKFRATSRVWQCAGYFLHSPKLYSTAENVNTELNGIELQNGIGARVDLQKELGCSRDEARTIVRKIRRITPLNIEDVLANLKHAKQQGISLAVMQENSWVLSLSRGELDSRLHVVRTLMLESTDAAVPLLQLSISQLILVCSFWRKESGCFRDGSRIMYLSRKLRCPARIICHMMIKYRFLQVLQASRLKKKCGITFETLDRHMQSRALLGSKSLYEFLADRLNCDVQTAKIMTERYPNVLHVNIPKINEVLDFLQKEGFSMEQVQQVPRILCHSLETIKARLTQLRMLGFNPVSLMVLCHSQQDYQKFVNKLEQRKTKAKTKAMP